MTEEIHPGMRLARFLELQGITGRELARRMNVHRNVECDLENGKRSDLALFERAASVLGIPVKELLHNPSQDFLYHVGVHSPNRRHRTCLYSARERCQLALDYFSSQHANECSWRSVAGLFKEDPAGFQKRFTDRTQPLTIEEIELVADHIQAQTGLPASWVMSGTWPLAAGQSDLARFLCADQP